MQNLVTEYIWPTSQLITIIGLLVIVFRALSVAHDLAKIALGAGVQQTTIKTVVAEKSIPGPALPVHDTAPPIVLAPVPHELIDDKFIAFVKKTEGFSAKAYGDFHQYSIGYGTKAKSPTEVITEPEAYKRLIEELNSAAEIVERFAPNAPRGVKQACTDLTYNAGSGWTMQHLGSSIHNGDYAEAKNLIAAYNHAGGKVNEGLTTRRTAEISWFDNPL